MNDYWLAGFLDSKASFSGTKNANNLLLRVTFAQNDELEAMTHIAELFGGRCTQSKEGSMVRVRINTIKGKHKVIEYLDQYSLHSNKLIPYLRFRALHLCLTDKGFKWSQQSESVQEELITFMRNINGD